MLSMELGENRTLILKDIRMKSDEKRWFYYSMMGVNNVELSNIN